MAEYLQQQRKLRVTTPLGPNDLLLKAFCGSEGISTLFSYRLEMLAENARELRMAVGREVRLKFTPELRFEIDHTLDQAERIEALIRKIHEDDAAPPRGAEAEVLGHALVEQPQRVREVHVP